MMKIGLFLITCLAFTTLFAQDPTPKTPKKKFDITNRPADHFMVQAAFDGLSGEPDSIKGHQSGFSRGLNIYIMTDKPFKGNNHYSIGLGIGVGSSNIFYKKANVDIRSLGTLLPFTMLDSTNHFKKYKVSESFLEIPLELRYASNPENGAKSWKIAVGVKAGTLINAHTKGKTLQDKNNNTVNSYIEKENSNKFFNTTRLAGTARIGYGIISLYGSYSLNNVLKDVAGAPMKLWEFGISLSGL